jgi:hypothetical protein
VASFSMYCSSYPGPYPVWAPHTELLGVGTAPCRCVRS